jgi:hypothetical protein
MKLVRFVPILTLLASTLMSSPAFEAALEATEQGTHDAHPQSALVNTVREATAPFLDIRNVPSDYGPVLGCVSGPEKGAMGVHFVNGALLGNGVLDARQPEALIYEFKDDVARLVGVEFIVLADVWHQTHAPSDPPVLEGQLLQFVESPNRFGLPAFYELHVWAWRENPYGVFTDWNPRVSCEGQ